MPKASSILRGLVQPLDAYLRRRQGIYEFTTDKRCILRIAIREAPWEVTLAGGDHIRAGDPVVELHFWNEHLPPIPSTGPDLRWALGTQHQVVHSLTLLAAYIQTNSWMRKIKAFRIRMALFGDSAPQRMHRLGKHLGFMVVPDKLPLTIRRCCHALGEDLLLWAMIAAFNPGARRFKPWRRSRYELWASRVMLLRRYAIGRGHRAAVDHADG